MKRLICNASDSSLAAKESYRYKRPRLDFRSFPTTRQGYNPMKGMQGPR